MKMSILGAATIKDRLYCIKGEFLYKTPRPVLMLKVYKRTMGVKKWFLGNLGNTSAGLRIRVLIAKLRQVFSWYQKSRRTKTHLYCWPELHGHPIHSDKISSNNLTSLVIPVPTKVAMQSVSLKRCEILGERAFSHCVDSTMRKVWELNEIGPSDIPPSAFC